MPSEDPAVTAEWEAGKTTQRGEMRDRIAQAIHRRGPYETTECHVDSCGHACGDEAAAALTELDKELVRAREEIGCEGDNRDTWMLRALAWVDEANKQRERAEAAEAQARDRQHEWTRQNGRVAELTTTLAKVREIHRPFGIYTECGHDHDNDEDVLTVGAPVIREVQDVGLVCDNGKLYDICTECHVEPGLDGEPEWVADDPRARWPCPTIRALDGDGDE